MKVIYEKKSVSAKVLEAIEVADMTSKKIDRIEITEEEADSLASEVSGLIKWDWRKQGRKGAVLFGVPIEVVG